MINNNWIFGKNCGLDFSKSPLKPTPTSNNAIDTNEGCASISDNNGNLLFYTDGQTIWDSTNSPKATGLLGDSSSTQSAIIVPDPRNSDQYYVLTTGGSTGQGAHETHFNGVLVNVASWGISPINKSLFPSETDYSPAEKLIAIQHKNCKDFWVITILQNGPLGTESGNGIFRIFKIDSSGIHHHQPDIPMGIDSTDDKIQIHDWGYLKASSDLQKIAIASGKQNNVLVYPFDNETGGIDINGLREIEAIEPKYGIMVPTYGVEFSPNSQLLYYSTFPLDSNTPCHIFQVDLTDPNLHQVPVRTFSNEEHFPIGALQLGIDKRIYFTRFDKKQLGVIEDPDVLGTACTDDAQFIDLHENSECKLGLPNLLPNACKDDTDCGCNRCDKDSDKNNKELIDRAKEKYHTASSYDSCDEPFIENRELSAIEEGRDFSPCFYFHWGDGSNDQIEEHDTEIFYLTVCNKYNDIGYRGLKITKVTITPDIHPLDKIHIVPDRFISLDCLKPSTCQTREFAIITRANDTAGDYTLEVEYCFEEIVFASRNTSGIAKFPLIITAD